MALKIAQQYLESLKDGRVVYFDGKRVPDVTEHPVCKITNDWVAMDYIMNNDPRYQDLLTDLDEDGERVSFALQPQRTREDLLRLREVVKLWARVCFGKPSGAKFVAKDGLNAVTVVAPAGGQEVRHQLRGQRGGVPQAPAEERPLVRHGPHRHQGRPQPAALRAGAAQGLLRPHRGRAAGRHHRQRGQDPHQPGSRLQRGAHRSLPGHAGGRRGLRRGLRHQPERARHHHDLRPARDPRAGADAVRPPHLRRPSTSTTPPSSSTTSSSPTSASSSRGSGSSPARWPTCSPTSTALSAETYKAMELELFTGAASLMAEYNGIIKKPHVREKLTWLVMYTEAVETLGKAAVEHCVGEEGSDLVYPNPMIANICKYYFADNWHQATKYIQDIGGGIIVTAPSSKDYFNPDTHDFMEKYFAGKAGVPTEHRLRMVKLVRDLTSCYEDVLTIHAEGSLEAQKTVDPPAGRLGPLPRRGHAGGAHPGRREAPGVRGTACLPAGTVDGRRPDCTGSRGSINAEGDGLLTSDRTMNERMAAGAASAGGSVRRAAGDPRTSAEAAGRVPPPAAAALVRAAVAAGLPALDEWRSKQLLAAYGVTVPAGTVVTDEAGAVEAGVRIGARVAMKAVGSQIHHKTERGLVLLGIPGRRPDGGRQRPTGDRRAGGRRARGRPGRGDGAPATGSSSPVSSAIRSSDPWSRSDSEACSPRR